MLTGWVPERIGFHDKTGKDLETAEGIERLYERMVSGTKFGDCLVTVASKELDDMTADKYGLVSSHAYAVLRVEQLGNHKFLLIKNPWAQTRWKGILTYLLTFCFEMHIYILTKKKNKNKADFLHTTLKIGQPNCKKH